MTKIDILLLGRPLRELDAIAAEIGIAIECAVGADGHREVPVATELSRFEPAAGAAEFKGVSVQVGRETVLDYMALRHGFVAPHADVLPPPTATERRIAQRLREIVSRAVEEALARSRQADAPGRAESSAMARRPGEMHWVWRASMAIGASPARPLTVALDTAASRMLEREAAQRRARASNSGEAAAEPAQAVLQMDLSARLVEMTVSAAALHNLKPGATLPITLGRAVALINGAPLLKAAVAEHQGKLHLTAFETLE